MHPIPVPPARTRAPAPRRPLRWAALLILGLLMSACATSPAPSTGSFVQRTLELDGRTHAYQVFVPAGRRSRDGTPVILFLHGSGERGDDGDKPTRVGLGPYLRQHADDFPALVVFPQAAEGTEWSDGAPIALAALEAATREFGGDRERTYLTGISMGGYGTWELALAEPGRFAALVPVCGGMTPPYPGRPTLRVYAVADAADPYAATAQRLHAIPTWLFHGARDDLVRPEQSRRMVAALEAAGARDVRYTEFPGANHNSWDPAYATPALWDWLFAQRLDRAASR